MKISIISIIISTIFMKIVDISTIFMKIVDIFIIIL